jgi:hypothetical protein
MLIVVLKYGENEAKRAKNPIFCSLKALRNKGLRAKNPIFCSLKALRNKGFIEISP